LFSFVSSALLRCRSKVFFRNETLIFSRELLLPNLKLFFGIGAAYLKIMQFCLY
jgi:hypothetical protein